MASLSLRAPTLFIRSGSFVLVAITLPPLLSQIIQGLGQLSERFPDQPFVPLVLQVAEWAKEFSPYDLWDVEDEDFLRAIRTHLQPQTA